MLKPETGLGLTECVAKSCSGAIVVVVQAVLYDAKGESDSLKEYPNEHEETARA